MKRNLEWVVIVFVLPLCVFGCKKKESPPSAPQASAPAPAQPESRASLVVSQPGEAGCAMCIYQMKEAKGCELAVKIDGKPYLVTGKSIDDLGDPHAVDGLCNTARAVQMEGRIEGDRFVAVSIETIPKE